MWRLRFVYNKIGLNYEYNKNFILYSITLLGSRHNEVDITMQKEDLYSGFAVCQNMGGFGRVFWVVFILFFLVLLVKNTEAIGISSCNTINSPGNYTLVTNITANLGQTCISIT